jgi:hypothetical protein
MDDLPVTGYHNGNMMMRLQTLLFQLMLLGVSLLAIVEGWFSPSFVLPTTRPTGRTSLLPFQKLQSSSSSSHNSHNDDDATLPIPIPIPAQAPAQVVWIFDETSLDNDAA